MDPTYHQVLHQGSKLTNSLPIHISYWGPN